MEPTLIDGIFHASAIKSRSRLEKDGCRLAYYTDADTAVKIIRSKRIWMRDTRLLNDYSEISYGKSLVEIFQSSNDGTNFENVMLEINENGYGEAKRYFEGWMYERKVPIYTTSVSCHHPSENELGRLSMWRAYGKPGSGVALIFNPEPFQSFQNQHDQLNVFTAPVNYWDKNRFLAEMKKIIDELKNNADKLGELTDEQFRDSVFWFFLSLILAVKHPGFSEEQEWRLVHSPDMFRSTHLEPMRETVAEIPQTIFKLPLQDYSEYGIHGASLPSLLERVIIGPSNQSDILAETFISELGEAKINDPQDKVIASSIPLRNLGELSIPTRSPLSGKPDLLRASGRGSFVR